MSFVRYGLHLFTNKPSYLVRCGSRIKTETENGVFLLRRDIRFSLKTKRVFLRTKRGNGRVRFGMVRVTNSDALLYIKSLAHRTYLLDEKIFIRHWLKVSINIQFNF